MDTNCTNTEVLFYAEDPGAANYIVHLPEACNIKGISSVTIAHGKATEFFLKQDVVFKPAENFLSVDDIIGAYSPNLIVIGTSENPESIGLSLVKVARQKNIPTVGVIDSPANAGYRFRGITNDPLASAPDWLIVPDEWTKNTFELTGFPSRKIAVCGHPQYDFVQDQLEKLENEGKENIRSRLFPGVPKDKIVALFAAEISDGLNPKQFIKSEEYTLFGNSGSNKRTNIVLEEFLDALTLIDERPYLILRLHPKNELDEFSDYIDSFDFISKNEPVMEVIYSVDCVIGMTTMLLQEAAIMGKQTLSIVPRKMERDWLPSIRSGITPCASTRDEINSLLRNLLQDASSGKQIRAKEFFLFGASKRAVSLFEDIITKCDSSE
ncbi:hypothetical protein ACFL2O_02480 [Thermodesulfobacteriota bacterium]